MANAINELQVIKKETLKDNVQAYQFENGTRVYHYHEGYYWYHYLKLPNGRRVDLTMSDLNGAARIYHTHMIGPYGDALYVYTHHPPPYQIRKGVWTSPTTISFSPGRTLDKDEKIHKGGMSWWLEGKGYCYKACDDPSKKTTMVDCPFEKMAGSELLGIHKGKLLYTTYDLSAFPTVQKLSEKVILIKKQHKERALTALCQDSSDYVYSLHGEHDLLTIDTRTIEILPLLHLSGIEIEELIGVFEGKMTMRCRVKYSEHYLITAQLPDGYFNQSHAVPQMPNIIDQMNATLTEFELRDKARDLEMERIQKRVNELEATNTQLINEKEALGQTVEELKNEQSAANTEENTTLKKEMEELSRKYRKLLMMSGREEK